MVPDFQSLMLPVLRRLASDGEQHSNTVRESVGSDLRLAPEDLAVMLPSGKQTTFKNRVAWALSYLKQAGLIESPKRGHYRVTARGRELLLNPPNRIDIPFLMQYPEFVAFRNSGDEEVNGEARAPVSGTSDELTPDEQIRQGYARLRKTLAAELLDRVSRGTPKFFEELVVDLLVRMGYGGSREDAASVVGRGGDEGIDGIIKEDRLGLDTIYIQAKRWKDNVGRPEIQRFAGALQGQRARKGVFITTSSFTADARTYATGLQTTIVLIDGAHLSQLMLDYDLGVTADTATVRLLRIDEDYFLDE